MASALRRALHGCGSLSRERLLSKASCFSPISVTMPWRHYAPQLLTNRPFTFSQPFNGKRSFASESYKDPDFFALMEEMPNSWVEPESLYEYATSQKDGADVDDDFAAEFGSRNEQWRQRMLKEDPELFTDTGAGQSPKYLWIGCSDSRVAAENMIDAKPGEVFVHRNIANLVVSTDFNVRAVLRYAVDFLKVEHIIVCGHYDCGGVKAALTNEDHTEPLESWLTNIRDVYRLHQQELEAILDAHERHKRLVELNVIEQCLNLFKTVDVQRRRASTGSKTLEYDCALPRIHAMVFDPSDGKLRRLPIDFKHYMKKYKKVYQMYDAADFFSSIDGAR